MSNNMNDNEMAFNSVVNEIERGEVAYKPDIESTVNHVLAMNEVLDEINQKVETKPDLEATLQHDDLLREIHQTVETQPAIPTPKPALAYTMPESFSGENSFALDLSEVKPFSEKTWSEVRQSIVEAVTPERPIGETLAELGESIVEALTPRKSLSLSLEEKAEEVSHNLQEAKKAIDEKADEVSHDIEEARKALGEKAEEVTHDIETKVLETRKAFEEKAEEVSHDIGAVVEDIQDKTIVAKEYVVQSVTESFTSFGDGLEQVGDGLHAAAIDFQEHANAAKEQASQSLDEVGQSVQAYIYGIENKGDYGHGFQAYMYGMDNEKVSVTFDNLAAKANEIEKQIEDFATAELQEPKKEVEVIKYKDEDITETIVYQELNPPQPIKDTFKENYNKMARDMNLTYDHLAETGQQVGEGMKDAAYDIQQKTIEAKNQLNAKAEELGHGLEQTATEVSQSISDTFNTQNAQPKPVYARPTLK